MDLRVRSDTEVSSGFRARSFQARLASLNRVEDFSAPLGISSLLGAFANSSHPLLNSSQVYRELTSLGQETDPEMFYSGLLVLGRRQMDQGHLELAAQVFAFIPQALQGQSFSGAQDIAREARASLDAMRGQGGFGGRFEFLLGRAAGEVVNPSMLLAMGLAGASFRVARLGLLGQFEMAGWSTTLGGTGIRLASNLGGFLVETTVFTASERALRVAFGQADGLHLGTFAHDWADGALFLGCLKLAGWGSESALRWIHGRELATGLAPALAGFQGLSQNLFRQSANLGGILAARGLQESFGLRESLDGATTFTDSLALLFNLEISGRLGSSLLGQGFRSWERSMDLHIERLSQSTGRPPPSIFSNVRDLWRGNFLLSGPRLAHAAAGDASVESEAPLNDGIDRSHLALMTRKRGEGSDEKPQSLPSMLRQISLFRDVRSVRLALRAIYIGVTGPLREEILVTLEKVEAGQAHGLVIRDLLADGRLQQTRFLSGDLQRRLSEQVRDLKGGAGNRDSGIFFFNLTHGLLEDTSVPKEPRKPTQLPVEALLPLQEVRLQELEKLLSGPDSAMPFTSKEALAEGLQLARNFARILNRTMKSKDRDFLTQVRNRANLDAIVPRLEQRLVKFMRYAEGPKLEDCVMMADIDFFKKVNDTYGHLAGDEVLRSFAEILREPETIRLRDIIARYGGEEFLIFLFKAGLPGALTAGERIRNIVAANPIEVDKEDSIMGAGKTQAPGRDFLEEEDSIESIDYKSVRQVTDLPNEKAPPDEAVRKISVRPGENTLTGEAQDTNGHILVPITVSIGIADMRPLEPNFPGGPPVIKGAFQDAVERADQALYAAKSVGRNRVVVYGDPHFDWDPVMLNQMGLEHMIPNLENGLMNFLSAPSGESSPWILRFNTDHLGLLEYVHGPEVSQEALKNVANTIRDTATRSNNLSARVGADDFLVYLKSADRDEVVHLAKQFRKNLSERPVLIDGHPSTHVTFSIGAAPVRPLPFEAEEGGPIPDSPRVEGAFRNAVERASAALLVAKKTGRNRLVVSTEDPK